jgi:hypothetical protein
MNVADSELRALDDAVEHALQSGDESALELLGYGEISSVLALATPRGRFAAKRMPSFPTQEAVEAYSHLLGDYVAALDAAGVRVLPTDVMSLRRAAGDFGVYIIQPALEPATLLPRQLAALDERSGSALDLLTQVVEAVERAVHPGVGLDAQLSNWACSGAELSYLDVSTPLLRDAGGRDQLDTELFLRSLPWALRPAVRRFALGAILDKYYLVRGALLDIAGNLQKEGLEKHLSSFLELVNPRLEPALTVAEVRAYYARDARLWNLLQRLRRADRGWQRLLGRTYPFLLPGAIARRT